MNNKSERGIKMLNSQPSNNKLRRLKVSLWGCLLLTLATVLPVAAQIQITTQETLLDRLQLEDMLLAYYYGFEVDDGHDWTTMYTDDAVLDINGLVYEGKGEIQGLYDNYAEISPEENVPGKVHVLMTNPRIIVTGNTATAHMIYTEVMNDSVYLAPRLIEQGREDTEFRKVDGSWYITKRLITQDGGLPPAYFDTYQPR
ncbi:MAG: nuclear transport factor 2 family protein [Gammaproteobacteria bacterium]|jgi:ketosteroid isomerase-like protein|nr:nuclear transport factor 2 family protein [Gammaproteobacteria bacterium]MBT6042264.1 nuclear transport factor 2 family protein [Gammaproteobacteria bacterium]